jgi:hypothetical protein
MYANGDFNRGLSEQWFHDVFNKMVTRHEKYVSRAVEYFEKLNVKTKDTETDGQFIDRGLLFHTSITTVHRSKLDL